MDKSKQSIFHNRNQDIDFKFRFQVFFNMFLLLFSLETESLTFHCSDDCCHFFYCGLFRTMSDRLSQLSAGRRGHPWPAHPSEDLRFVSGVFSVVFSGVCGASSWIVIQLKH